MIVLQRQITLDEAVLEGIRTFRNGCNFRVLFEGDRAWLEYGCYGVHRNLTQGTERLLMQWLDAETPEQKFIRLAEGRPKNPRKLLDVSQETFMELKKRKPCECCGAPWFSKENWILKLEQIQHPRYRLTSPIDLLVRYIGEYIIKFVPVDIFAHGTNLHDTMTEFGTLLADYYESLLEDRDSLAVNLRAEMAILEKILVKR